MRRALFLLAGCLLALFSCTQRLICPAYQSAFIHDQEAQYKQFSYFKEDSTPKILTVSKNKYLIIPEQSYRKKIRSMQTIEMKSIHPKVPDSLLMAKKNDEFAGAEQDTRDSTATDSTAARKAPEDSVYVITKDREVRLLKYDTDSLKYRVENVMYTADQDNYMWYFRDVLVLPDVRAALEDEKNAKEGKTAGGKTVKKQKTGFFGFFKDLFKKKPKNDSTSVSGPPTDSAPDSLSANPPKEKKGFFKRKKKQSGSTTEKKKDPAKKEDDGF
jgi:hypothetical protein